MKVRIYFLIQGLLFLNISFLQTSPTEKVFTDFYDQGLWGNGNTPDGSLLQNARPYIDFLQSFIKEHNIQSVVEVGCGDWKVSRYISWQGVNYTGYDVVKSVIEENQEKYGTPHTTFIHADILTTALPKADLLICKDVLQHLPNSDIITFLKQTSKFKHCLITNDTIDGNDNRPTYIGGYRSIDLSRPPFNISGEKFFSYFSGNYLKQVFYIKNDTRESNETKKVLIAILAKNKAHMMPQYLDCIEKLDYPKKLITVYVRTNNNTDTTKEILTRWCEKNRSQYNDIIFEGDDIQNVDQTIPHAWPQERLKLLARIRNRSLEKARECKTDFYFVADCDNFVLPHTLKYLIHKDKPFIAPLLRSMPRSDDPYSNYFADIDKIGYFMKDPDYYAILKRSCVGTFKVPLVHCTYLIKTEYLDRLQYLDDTNDMEFVIICRMARKNGIDQYICNEREFGTLYHPSDYSISLSDEIKDFQSGLRRFG